MTRSILQRAQSSHFFFSNAACMKCAFTRACISLPCSCCCNWNNTGDGNSADTKIIKIPDMFLCIKVDEFVQLLPISTLCNTHMSDMSCSFYFLIFQRAVTSRPVIVPQQIHCEPLRASALNDGCKLCSLKRQTVLCSRSDQGQNTQTHMI